MFVNSSIEKKITLTWVMSLCLWLTASCSDGEIPAEEQSGTPVSFMADSEWKDFLPSSRAETTSYTGEFGVFAYYNDADAPNFMNNEDVKKENNEWTYSPIKYWPNNSEDPIDFYAYAPYDDKIEYEGKKITYVVPNDVTDHKDLLWDNQLAKTKKNGTVTFNFKHALARIGFTAQAKLDGGEWTTEQATITVKELRLTQKEYDADGATTEAGPFYTQAKLDLSSTNGTAWDDYSNDKQAFVLDDDNFSDEKTISASLAAGTEPSQLNKDDSFILIIPQKTNFNLFVQYEVKIGEAEYTNNFNKSIEEIDFIAGKSYTFNLILGLYSMKVESIEIKDFIISGVEYELNGEY